METIALRCLLLVLVLSALQLVSCSQTFPAYILPGSHIYPACRKDVGRRVWLRPERSGFARLHSTLLLQSLQPFRGNADWPFLAVVLIGTDASGLEQLRLFRSQLQEHCPNCFLLSSHSLFPARAETSPEYQG